MALGRIDAADAGAVRIGRGLRRDHDHRPAARGHFLQVRGGLFEHLIHRGEGDDRRQFVDESDGPVLQLAGGIALGMDVADLLQLQRAFHGQREHRATAEEQYVRGLGDVIGDRLQVVFHAHGLGDQPRGLEQGLDQFGLLRGVDDPALHPGGDGEGQQGGDLGGERLGRGHADLGAGVGRPEGLGLPRHR